MPFALQCRHIYTCTRCQAPSSRSPSGLIGLMQLLSVHVHPIPHSSHGQQQQGQQAMDYHRMNILTHRQLTDTHARTLFFSSLLQSLSKSSSSSSSSSAHYYLIARSLLPALFGQFDRGHIALPPTVQATPLLEAATPSALTAHSSSHELAQQYAHIPAIALNTLATREAQDFIHYVRQEALWHALVQAHATTC